MSGTVKPLGPRRREANANAGDFHAAVVRVHGRLCFFHDERMIRDLGKSYKRPRKPNERCEGKSAAVVHAAHVIPRGSLGPKTRYAIPEINGRPACPTCHALQECGMLEFPAEVNDRAVLALMKLSPRLAGDLQKLLRGRGREARDGAAQPRSITLHTAENT